jgi:hypothetical protein
MATRGLRFAAAVCVPLLFASAGALPALAEGGARSVTWQCFDVDLNIQRDGAVNVTETQVIQFSGTFQSRYPHCPTRSDYGRHGRVCVGDCQRPANRLLARHGSPQTPLRARSARTGCTSTGAVRTFVVRYTVSGAVRVCDRGDRLGGERSMPIGQES